MTTTRQAIREMHKRGFDGETIIDIAKIECRFGLGTTPANALVAYVNSTPNTRFCPSCHGPHFVQDCGETAFWLNASNITFNKFMEENGL